MDYSAKASLVIYYLIFINLTSLILFALDKYRASRRKWRISEKSLMTLAIIGGSLGSLIGMYFFRHKTHKRKFTVGLPLILVMQIILFVYIFL